jgi:hypothetical protein
MLGVMPNPSAVRLLDNCEKGLRDLLAKAAAEGEYADIIQLTSWAKVVHGLVGDAKSERGTPGSSALRAPNGRLESFPMPGEPRKVRKGPQRSRSTKLDGYPKFFRSTDELVKVGWSKREKAEYQHRAPYGVLSLLIRKLALAGAGGRMFTANDVFPLNTDHGTEIPIYQGYLCLAWLRSEGLIQPHGRQGYTVSNEEKLVAAVDDHWQSLNH